MNPITPKVPLDLPSTPPAFSNKSDISESPHSCSSTLVSNFVQNPKESWESPTPEQLALADTLKQSPLPSMVITPRTIDVYPDHFIERQTFDRALSILGMPSSPARDDCATIMYSVNKEVSGVHLERGSTPVFQMQVGQSYHSMYTRIDMPNVPKKEMTKVVSAFKKYANQRPSAHLMLEIDPRESTSVKISSPIEHRHPIIVDDDDGTFTVPGNKPQLQKDDFQFVLKALGYPNEAYANLLKELYVAVSYFVGDSRDVLAIDLEKRVEGSHKPTRIQVEILNVPAEKLEWVVNGVRKMHPEQPLEIVHKGICHFIFLAV